MPINSKKVIPSTCKEGCLLTKPPTGLAKSIIISTDTTMTTTIIKTACPSPLVIPTAVSIESKEKTKLIAVILMMAFDK